MHADLRAAGTRVNRKRVERVMRKHLSTHRIIGAHLPRRCRTTVSDPVASPVPDLLKRDFTATAPDTRWVGDITSGRGGSQPAAHLPADLRHGAATILLRAGHDMKVVQETLGLSSITIASDTYTSVLPDLARAGRAQRIWMDH